VIGAQHLRVTVGGVNRVPGLPKRAACARTAGVAPAGRAQTRDGARCTVSQINRGALSRSGPAGDFEAYAQHGYVYARSSVTASGGVTADIERLWITARNTHGQFGDRRRPSPGIAAVLGALWWRRQQLRGRNRAAYQTGSGQHGALAREAASLRSGRCGRRGAGHRQTRAGGRPAIFWQLMGAGRSWRSCLARQVEMAA